MAGTAVPGACARGDGAAPGAADGTRRGSPAGLGSSAGRAGLEELRGQGASRPAPWQLLGAHSTHRELVGSLGVTRAMGQTGRGCGDRSP